MTNETQAIAEAQPFLDLAQTTISEPRSLDLSKHVDVTLTMTNGEKIPFCAVANDSEAYGREIYANAVAGNYGSVAIAPADGATYFWIDGAWVNEANAYTHDELVAQAEATRNNLLATARKTISEWQSELLLGTITDDEKAQLVAWLAYIKLLKAVDTSTAPDITWPPVPATA